MELVRRTKNKLNLGYCMVRGRGQQDKSLSTIDRHEKEKQFSNTALWSVLGRERVGIPALQDRPRELLVNITRREFPNVKHEIDKRLLNCEQKLKSLGPARETYDQQRTFLLDLAAKFIEETSRALDADYSRSSLFGNNPSLRLATRIIDLNTAFSDDVWLKGHTIHFSKSTVKNGNESATEPPDDTHSVVESPNDAEQAAIVDTSYSTSETGEPNDSDFPELSESLAPCCSSRGTKIIPHA